MRQVSFIVDGPPASWSRARSAGKARFNSDAHVAGLTAIRAAALAAHVKPITGPVLLDIEAVYEPPKSLSSADRLALHGQPKITTPDSDNLAKLVGDGLNGIAYRDDAQIASLMVSKLFGPVAHTRITIMEIPVNSGINSASNRALV